MPPQSPLVTPVFVIGGLIAMAVFLFYASKSVRGLLMVVAGMMVMASLSRHVTWDGKVYQTWLLPIQVYRSELYIGLALVLIAGILFHAGGLRETRLSRQVLVLWIIGMYAGSLRVVHSSLGDATVSILVSVFTVLPLAFAVQANSHDHASLFRAIRVIPIAGLIWLLATAIQVAISPALVMTIQPPRFIGLSNNPQSAAIMLALWSVVTLWLALNEPGRRARIFWFLALGMFLLFLMGTASRTGLLMVIVGTTFVAYQRLGAMVFLLPLIAILLFGLIQLASLMGLSMVSERILSTENTRARVWGRLITVAMEHPIIGVGQSKELGSENSYLQGFAAYGAGMLALLMVFLAVTGGVCMKMFRASRLMHPAYRPFVSLCLGFNAAYLVGSVFEGYLLSRVSVSLVAMVIVGTVTARVLSWHKEGLIGPELAESGESDGDTDILYRGSEVFDALADASPM